MGIINDLKKLFFGASSVSKHAAEKTGNYIKEESEEIIDSAKNTMAEAADAVIDKTSGLKDSIKENSNELIEKAKSKIDEIAETPIVKKAAEVSEDIGDKILTAGEKVFEKASDLSEKIGEKGSDAAGKRS